MNTYQDQLELVAKGWAKAKTEGDLTIFKYSRKVMYDYLWKQDERLLECRGHIYNNKTGELVQAAPRKSFNYLEDGWWKDVPLDTPVQMFKKFNGFMACATMYNGELLVSTTGSLTSEYQQWAKEAIGVSGYNTDEYYTDLYEIILNQDPHIVAEEQYGAIYLGSRSKASGIWYPSGWPTTTTLGEAINIAATDRGEGFMVYPYDSTDHLAPCKLKTPYYIGKKKLMRLSPVNTDQFWATDTIWKTLPEMWKLVGQMLRAEYTAHFWINTPEQERRAILEEYEKKGYV